ncbi:D-3-phosphoglycerate dehydrogenase, chloroplastic [Hordeum vulgare]|nr:D-3-phosphoglycerate dehydrogenase, chloroplastic [Hordeum vulgare]
MQRSDRQQAINAGGPGTSANAALRTLGCKVEEALLGIDSFRLPPLTRCTTVSVSRHRLPRPCRHSHLPCSTTSTSRAAPGRAAPSPSPPRQWTKQCSSFVATPSPCRRPRLCVPVHSLRVTAHHPEYYFVIFTQPSHQGNAVRRGSTRVEGACFNIASWHEHDHATFDSLLLHVRVVIEKAPMQFWSVDGAEEILGKRVLVDRLDNRTLEHGHTKTFACWVWTSDIANIPTTHTLAVLPRGARWVEEMEGFSPPTGASRLPRRRLTTPC